jgi:hypothetical protein
VESEPILKEEVVKKLLCVIVLLAFCGGFVFADEIAVVSLSFFSIGFGLWSICENHTPVGLLYVALGIAGMSLLMARTYDGS